MSEAENALTLDQQIDELIDEIMAIDIGVGDAVTCDMRARMEREQDFKKEYSLLKYSGTIIRSWQKRKVIVTREQIYWHKEGNKPSDERKNANAIHFKQIESYERQTKGGLTCICIRLKAEYKYTNYLFASKEAALIDEILHIFDIAFKR